MRRRRTLALALVGSTDALSTAQSAGSDDDNGDDSGAGASGSTSTALLAGATGVTKLLRESGDALLIRRVAGFWSDAKVPICQNAPFILSRDGPSNQNCIASLHALGLSCTCLTGFVKKSPTWEFHVAQKRKTTGTPATAVDPASALGLTKIAPFVLAQWVTTVKIIGDGNTMAAIEFTDDLLKNGNKETPKFETAKGSTATLTTVHIENIAIGSAINKPDFFRSTLTDLTLRNCNLADGSTAFFSTLALLKVVNVENNKFTKIPPELLLLPGVEQVFLGGNAITGVTLTEKQFQFIKAMKAFNIDASGSATTCAGGQLKTAHDVAFCVSDSQPPASGVAPQMETNGSRQTGTPVANEAASSGTSKYLLIGAISGSVIVVILIFFIIRRRSSRHKDDAYVKHLSHSILEDTLSYDQSKDSLPSALDPSLLNDPIIITHRIPYNDVKVATCISRGGFGLVYSGTFNRRRVAIKRIRSDLSADIKYIEAFLKEICLMASLNHPRIVEFVGVAWDSLRNLSAVTEFMERGDLRDVLHGAKTRNARLTWDGHKVRIAMHIAEALTYLHSLSPKVIHRDLKSKNVLLDSDMTAKLSDFGVSRERRFEETHMTAGVGTAFWIAPEVLLGMDYDERADIFSFGVVLSEIDTDDYPYWNEANPALGGKQQENVILRMVATGALRPEFSPECPSSILELAHACLDVDPAKRPTAAEIAYRLQQLMRSSPLTADVSVVLSPNEETKRSSV